MAVSTADIALTTTVEAWEAGAADQPPPGGRPYLLIRGTVSAIECGSVPEPLPCAATWTDSDGTPWSRFELPSTAVAAAGGPASEQVELRVYTKTGVSVRQVVVSYQVPKLPVAGESDPEPDLWRTAAEAAEAVIDGHIEFVNQLWDAVPRPGEWSRRTGGIRFVPVAQAVETWRHAGGRDAPRMALIVRLARGLPPPLGSVCLRPRRILTRERQLQPVARVQEVDPACIRWLARQPGGNVVEKAGFRQTVLGVVRKEQTDTPENRVVRDLLRRAWLACTRYIREHRAAAEHPRVVDVRRFARSVRSFATTSDIGCAGELVGVPQPNYVLQHDQRYRLLWKAYTQLVRQQTLEDSVWRWRHRVWSEQCLIAVISATMCAPAVSPVAEGELLIRDEHDSGRFVDARTGLPPWSVLGNAGERIDLLLPGQVDRYPLDLGGVNRLSPDGVLVRRRGKSLVAAVAWWCSLHVSERAQDVARMASSLDAAVEGAGLGDLLRGLCWVPQPMIATADGALEAAGPARRCQFVLLPLPLQGQIDQIWGYLRWALRLV